MSDSYHAAQLEIRVPRVQEDGTIQTEVVLITQELDENDQPIGTAKEERHYE